MKKLLFVLLFFAASANAEMAPLHIIGHEWIFAGTTFIEKPATDQYGTKFTLFVPADEYCLGWVIGYRVTIVSPGECVKVLAIDNPNGEKRILKEEEAKALNEKLKEEFCQ